MKLQKIVLTLLLTSASLPLLGYALYFKTADSACNLVKNKSGQPTVTIYIGKNSDSMGSYLKAEGFSEDFIKGLAISSEYAEKAAPWIKKGVAFIPEIGAILASAVEPVVGTHKFLVVTIPQSSLGQAALKASLRKKTRVIAVHRDVPVGGSDAWNWASIKSQYSDRPKGSTIYMTVMSGDKVLLWNRPFKTDEGVAFDVKKDPVTGNCFALVQGPAIAQPAPKTKPVPIPMPVRPPVRGMAR